MEVNAATLAECFNVSKRRVQQMADDGIAVKLRRGVYDLGPSVKNYIDSMTENGKTTAEKHYDDIRADHEAVKMRKTELTVARMEGRMHLAEDVAHIWNNMAATVKTRLLAIPVKLSPQLAGLTDPAEIQDKIQREVTNALNEVADYDPAQYDSYDEDDGEETEEDE